MEECKYHTVTQLAFDTYICESCHTLFIKLPEATKEEVRDEDSDDFDASGV